MKAIAATLVLLASLALAQQGRFTDVTQESGVEAMVREHHASHPKWWLSGMDFIDIDGDGFLDLHLAGHGFIPAAGRNDGKGHFAYVRRTTGDRKGDVTYPDHEIYLPCDFNEDGRPDIVATYSDGGGRLYLNDSTPDRWSFRPTKFIWGVARGSSAADMNKDGILDYITCDGTDHAIYFGHGDGTFESNPVRVPGGFVQSGRIPVDVDDDGDIDLLCHGNDKGNFYAPGGKLARRLLLNDGNLTFKDVAAQAGLLVEDWSIHGVADVNQDSHLDLICAAPRGNKEVLSIWLNDGKGHFTKKPDAITRTQPMPGTDYPYWGGAIMTDFDNDGIPDLIVNYRNGLVVLRGMGGGSFEFINRDWGIPTFSSAAVDEGICFGDMNGDGMLDIVACRAAQGDKIGVHVLRNDLPRRNWLNVQLVGKQGNRMAANAKIRLYRAGGLDDPAKLLWYEQVCIWNRQSLPSYYAARNTERHFGLGDREQVDVSIVFYPSGKKVQKAAVQANHTLVVSEEAQ